MAQVISKEVENITNEEMGYITNEETDDDLCTTESTDSIPDLAFDDLPNELILRVLQNLDTKNLNNSSMVCKRWHAIVDEMIGKKLCIGRRCQVFPPYMFSLPKTYIPDIFVINKIGVHECFFGEVVEPARTEALWTRLFSAIRRAFFHEAEEPEFGIPHLVKTLHFDGPIPNNYFKSVLRDLVALARMEFHWTAMIRLKPDYLEQLGSSLKKLEQLSFWGHKITEGMFTANYETNDVIPNVMTVLGNHFPSLTYFAIEFPYDVPDDREMTRGVWTFLQRNAIKYLRIALNIPIRLEGTDNDTLEEREWKRQARSIAGASRISAMELTSNTFRKVRITKTWMAFVEGLRGLEKVMLFAFRIPYEIVPNICSANSDTIKLISVTRILMTNPPFAAVQIDGSIFAPCSKLSDLRLEGMLSIKTQPGFLRTRLLPKTIVNLHIGGLLLSHEDAHDLFFELPLLQNITVADIGTRSNFGLRLESLEQLIITRHIAIVNVYRSICGGEFPAAGIPNGDPEKECLIKKRPFELVEMKLNANGYYVNNYTRRKQRVRIPAEMFMDDPLF